MIVWNVKKACAEMCISRSTLYKLLAEKRLRRIKLGRGTFVCPAEARSLFGLPVRGDDPSASEPAETTDLSSHAS